MGGERLTLDTQCLHMAFLLTVGLEISAVDPPEEADMALERGRSIFYLKLDYLHHA